jgi:hypothetical protein
VVGFNNLEQTHCCEFIPDDRATNLQKENGSKLYGYAPWQLNTVLDILHFHCYKITHIPCHHSMARPQVADEGTVSSCKYIE